MLFVHPLPLRRLILALGGATSGKFLLWTSALQRSGSWGYVLFTFGQFAAFYGIGGSDSAPGGQIPVSAAGTYARRR